jgi:hypothetical protein
MNIGPWRSSWTDLLGFSLVSLLFYKLGIFFLVFLIPLQVLFIRRGLITQLYSFGIVLFFIFIFAAFSTRKIENGTLRTTLLMLEMVIPVLLMTGLAAVNAHNEYIHRNLYKLLAATVITGLVGIVVIVVMMRSEAYIDFIKDQMDLMLEAFSQAFTAESTAGLMFGGMVTTERIFEMARKILLRNFLFLYFMVLAGNWRAGTAIGKRSIGGRVTPFSRFSLPDFFIWPLLFSWTGVLFDSLIGLGFLSYIFWNSGLVFLFLYGLQGVAIIRHLFEKYNVSRGLRFLFGFGAVFLFMIPGLNFLLIIGIPGLGVSELWIKLRKE